MLLENKPCRFDLNFLEEEEDDREGEIVDERTLFAFSTEIFRWEKLINSLSDLILMLTKHKTNIIDEEVSEIELTRYNFELYMNLVIRRDKEFDWYQENTIVNMFSNIVQHCQWKNYETKIILLHHICTFRTYDRVRSNKYESSSEINWNKRKKSRDE